MRLGECSVRTAGTRTALDIPRTTATIDSDEHRDCSRLPNWSVRWQSGATGRCESDLKVFVGTPKVEKEQSRDGTGLEIGPPSEFETTQSWCWQQTSSGQTNQ